MKGGNLLLQNMTWKQIEAAATQDAVILLPVGSIEQHGVHLPLCVDAMIVEAVALESSRIAAESTRVYVAPTLQYGYSDEHFEYPGVLSLKPNLLLEVYLQIITSLYRSGFRRIFILNGHGGNEPVVNLALMESRSNHLDLLIVGASYWQLAAEDLAQIQKDPWAGIGHGGEVETALVAHLDPSLVDFSSAMPNQPRWGSPYLKAGFHKPPAVQVGRRRADITVLGHTGNPRLGTPEKGAEMFQIITQRVGAFIVDFAKWNFPVLSRKR